MIHSSHILGFSKTSLLASIESLILFSVAAYFNFPALILASFPVFFSFFLLPKFVLHAFALSLFSTR